MRFAVLDGWRGVAALMLVFVRFDTNGELTFSSLVRNSYLFVDFFFVLSGFVIAHAYGTRIVDRTSAIAFMIRRFGRLWPLHAFMLVLFIVVIELPKLALGTPGAFTGQRAPHTIVEQVFLVQALGFSTTASWNTPAWSISTEFWTYLVFAAVALMAPGRRHMIAGLLIAGSMAAVIALSDRGMDATFDHGLWRCIAGFFVGVLVQHVFALTHERVRLGRGAFSVLEIGLVVACFAFVATVGTGPASFAAPALFAVVVYVFAFERGVASTALLGRVGQALGRWSYSIYMIALFCGEVLRQVLKLIDGRLPGISLFSDGVVDGVERTLFDVGHGVANDAVLILFVIGVLLASSLTYRFVEAPARDAFNRLADRFTEAKRARPSVRPSAPDADGRL